MASSSTNRTTAGHRGNFPSTYWFHEVWTDNRHVFKILIGDFIMFAIVISLFSAGHLLIQFLVEDVNMKLTLESFHFLFTTILLLVFSFVLIIEILAHAYSRIGKGSRNE